MILTPPKKLHPLLNPHPIKHFLNTPPTFNPLHILKYEVNKKYWRKKKIKN